MELRTLIVDDDAGMRLVLKKIIDKSTGFTWVGEAEDGETALGLAASLKPHVVFLDVEMPKMGGVECAKKIAELFPKTIFVFATAHEGYMQDAFELYAFDYLIKPFKLERIEQTLKRIQETYSRREAEALQQLVRHDKGLDKLFIRNKDGVSLVNIDDIVLIQRENRATVIYTPTEQFQTSEGLTELEEHLDSARFMRCHKSYVINLSMVSKIYPYGRWTYIVKLKGITQDALMTSDKYEALQQALSGKES